MRVGEGETKKGANAAPSPYALDHSALHDHSGRKLRGRRRSNTEAWNWDFMNYANML